MSDTLGRHQWVIAEGYIPSESYTEHPGRALESHETACILNPSDRPANVEITIYFADREPVGPYRLMVDARRTKHLRFNDLQDPAPVPRDTDFASVIQSSVPIVVQHTRLDSRQPAHAVLTTVAWSR
ncbi:MAG: sensory rhodopsin transducer [Chloroflexota bacterium]